MSREMEDSSKTGGSANANSNLILLAKDKTGYHNLVKLVSLGYLEGFLLPSQD